MPGPRNRAATIPKYTNGGTPTYYGPVGYSVSNHAGRSEFSGTIGFGSSAPFTTTTAINTWINTGSANPITAVFGSGLSLSQGSATLYDNAGAKTTAQRMYTNLSTPSYDESTFAYDDMGRVIRSVDPTGTINRTLYDALGRMIAHSVGTDDTGLPGSPLSGTSNMFTTDQTTYDGAAISAIAGGGNSHATARKLHPTASSGDDRTTTYIHDFRGRTIVITNPVAPHSVSAYDNRRMVAGGTYGDTTGFDASTDPRTTTTDRLSLSESFFDARGQSWKQIQWEIDQSDGTKTSGGTRFLESRSVFGPAGEVLQSRGSDAHRYNYDRLRRRTHDWTLAYTSAWDTDHDVYDDIFDAAVNTTLLSSDSSTGDVVLEEGRTIYDDAKNFVLVSAMVSRHHDDETTHFTSTTITRGPLDGTSGTSPTFDVSVISGRLHGITAMYYDDLDRPSVTAVYGDARTTLGSADYTYDPTAPTSSAVATSSDPAVLVSSRDYDKFGRTERVHDPKDLKTEYTYDDAGRIAQTRANAVGSPGQDTVDTHFTYANGLRTEMWVDKNLNGTYSATTPDFDQKTVYAYASNLSPGGGNPASLVTVNNMLTSVTYPDGGVVKYGYNALGQQRQMKDQAGNFFDTTYDLGGRETLRVVTTVVSPFDTTLRAVKTVYGDPRGMVTKLAQYSDTSATTLLDSVEFAYDHAGNLAERTQTIDGHSWTTSFSHDLHAPNGTSNLRSTYVLGELTYPDTTAVGYSYVDSGSWDRAAERVSTVWVDRADDGVGATTLAAYWYNGAAELMEHRAYFSSGSFAERSLAHSLDDLDPGSYRTYPNLDAFDRVTHSWLRRINVTTTPTTSYATFYKVSMLTSAPAAGYDFNSNIVGLKDDRWNRYSADFSVDGLNRLTQRTKFVYVGMNESWSMDRLGNFIGVCEGGSPTPGLVTDFNGDGTIAGPDTSECRTANTSNQITARSGTPGSLTPVYDIVGNLTDDGTGTTSSTLYTYTWDALGRLTEVWNKASTPLQIAVFRYSADNHRIAWKYPQGDNTWYYPVYDHRWRMIAVYKGMGEDPPTLQERFYYHNAGVAGYGGSQYIDSVIARDDTRTNVADPEEDPVYQLTRTMYYAQNWRGDVVGLLNVDGSLFEHVRYTSYGRPVAVTAANVSGNGTSSIDDIFLYQNLWFGNNQYADFNMDGIISIDDLFLHQNAWFTSSSGGVDALASGSGNRKGYAGYEHDAVVRSLQLARYRYYRADLATWLRKDPIGAAAGPNLYAYGSNSPILHVDPRGLIATSSFRSSMSPCNSCAISGTTPTSGQEIVIPQGYDCIRNSYTLADCLTCCVFPHNGQENPICAASCKRVFIPGTEEPGGTPVECDAAPDTPSLTDEQCCDKARKCVGSTDNPTEMLVCCQGRKVSCWSIGYVDPTGWLIVPDQIRGLPSLRTINKCSLERIDDLKSSIDCDSKTCPGKVCLVPYRKGTFRSQTECSAFLKEFQCLTTAINNCRASAEPGVPNSYTDCVLDLVVRRNKICAKIKMHCGGSSPAECP